MQIVKFVVCCLLSSKADPSIQDYEGNYPLHYAVLTGQIELVDTLLKSGAKLDVVNKKGQKPLSLCNDSKMRQYLESFSPSAPIVPNNDMIDPYIQSSRKSMDEIPSSKKKLNSIELKELDAEYLKMSHATSHTVQGTAGQALLEERETQTTDLDSYDSSPRAMISFDESLKLLKENSLLKETNENLKIENERLSRELSDKVSKISFLQEKLGRTGQSFGLTNDIAAESNDIVDSIADLQLSVLKSSQRSISETLASTHQHISRISVQIEGLSPNEDKESLLALESRQSKLEVDSQTLQREHDKVVSQIEQLSDEKEFKKQPDDGFVFLEDLLSHLEPAEHSRTALQAGTSRFSLMIRDSPVSTEIDSATMGKLLQASKSRIQHLKTTIVSLRTSNETLRSELEEANIHLTESYALIRAANTRCTDSECKNLELLNEQTELLSQIESLNAELKSVEHDRVSELELLYETAKSLVGDASEANEQISLLGAIDAAISKVDPVFRSKLNSQVESVIDAPSTDFNASSLSRQNSQILSSPAIHESVLSFADALLQGFKKSIADVRQIESLITIMSEENKKYVKEIVRMRNANLLRSFLDEIKESDVQTVKAEDSIEASRTKTAFNFEHSPVVDGDNGKEIKDQVLRAEKQVQNMLDGIQKTRRELASLDKSDSAVFAEKQRSTKLKFQS